MSEAVTDDTDALAAEYVLGTLDFEERSQAQALVGSDEAFAAKVKVWERRLGELHLMVEPVEPDGHIWERIKAKMPEVQAAPAVAPSEAPAEAPTQPDQLAPPADETSLWSSLDQPLPGMPPAVAAAAAAENAIKPGELGPAAVAPDTDVAPSLSTALVPPTRNPLLIEAREEAAAAARRVGRWRGFAMLMTLVAAALAALMAAWRFAPDRVPAFLQPAALAGRTVAPGTATTPAPAPSPQPAPAPSRRPPPPESQFDE